MQHWQHVHEWARLCYSNTWFTQTGRGPAWPTCCNLPMPTLNADVLFLSVLKHFNSSIPAFLQKHLPFLLNVFYFCQWNYNSRGWQLKTSTDFGFSLLKPTHIHPVHKFCACKTLMPCVWEVRKLSVPVTQPATISSKWLQTPASAFSNQISPVLSDCLSSEWFWFFFLPQTFKAPQCYGIKVQVL